MDKGYQVLSIVDSIVALKFMISKRLEVLFIKQDQANQGLRKLTSSDCLVYGVYFSNNLSAANMVFCGS